MNDYKKRWEIKKDLCISTGIVISNRKKVFEQHLDPIVKDMLAEIEKLQKDQSERRRYDGNNYR